MNVARLNFSHGTHEAHAKIIGYLKKAREELKVPLAIVLDTKGPEIRLGHLKENSLHLKAKDQIWLVKEEIEGDDQAVTIMPPQAIDALEVGMTILFDDGYLITHVVEIEENRVKIEVDHGGVIKSLRGVNIPGVDIDLPAITEKDILDIEFGCEHDVDYVAASFVRSASQVIAIKQLLKEHKKSEIGVIAKIENRVGVDNFDSIVQVADAIMIARGDLGVELPLTQVPRLQKMMIEKSYLAGKPSVTATQMLESMIDHPRPTRAEASDVANAMYDGTSAVMLSGETAVGRYPFEVLKVMGGLLEETERDFDYYDFFQKSTQRSFHDVPSSVTQASIKTAYSSNASAIFAFTTSGFTARLLSRFRPKPPVIAMTSNRKVYHKLALYWGVIPFYCETAHSTEEAYKLCSDFALERSIVEYGDLVVVTAGTPFGRAGTTNMMIVDSIGDVLVRGNEGYGLRTHGRVALVFSSETPAYSVRGKILVLTKCDESYLPLLRMAAGVILENHIDDVESELYLKEVYELLNLPIILRGEGASSVLRPEILVTLDPSQAIAYKGLI